MLKIIFVIIVLLHAFIHLLGFAKAFNIAEIDQLTQSISKISGIFWMSATVLFFGAMLLFLSKQKSWWIIALASVGLSQILILRNWGDAKFGTIMNIIILLPVVIAFFGTLPSSFQNVYKAEVQKRLAPIPEQSVVSEADLRHLPEPVQKYLRYVGAVGKPKVRNIRMVFKGQLKQKKASKWMNISSEQYNFYGDYARFFYIKSSMFGIPFDGLHAYVGGKATMKIKVASLFQVADAKGDKMDRGETVTVFNDMCVFAPATLVDNNIEWEEVDLLTVMAKFTNRDITIEAVLSFNEEGALIDFISGDRYYTVNGDEYINYEWSTPISSYKDFNGRKAPTYGEAIWHTPEGEFTYIRFDITEIDYNLEIFK
ncbi:MAG: hypothetical protein JXB23_04725 [Candidatus Aminicenantes bacterium]|nr:hypothetical protein [Candidatus Aminicenantes bacterium]